MDVKELTKALLQRMGLMNTCYRVHERILAMIGRIHEYRSTDLHAPDLPIPPPYLRVLVGGLPDTESFLVIGRSMFHSMFGMLERNRVEVKDMAAVLEFGCGCGRVLRYWHSVQGPEIHGVDYNPKLVEWCRINLPFARFQICGSSPPLP